jgi:hypothetical protein
MVVNMLEERKAGKYIMAVCLCVRVCLCLFVFVVFVCVCVCCVFYCCTTLYISLLLFDVRKVPNAQIQ